MIIILAFRRMPCLVHMGFQRRRHLPHPPELKLPPKYVAQSMSCAGRQHCSRDRFPPSFPSLHRIKAIQCLAPSATQFSCLLPDPPQLVHHAMPHVHVRPGTQNDEEKGKNKTDAAASTPMYMVPFYFSGMRFGTFVLMGDSVQWHWQWGQILSAVTPRHVTMKSVWLHTPFQSVLDQANENIDSGCSVHLESSPK